MIDHNGVDDCAPVKVPIAESKKLKPDPRLLMSEKERTALPKEERARLDAIYSPRGWFDNTRNREWTTKPPPKGIRVASDADGTPWTFALKAGEGGPRETVKSAPYSREDWLRDAQF